MRPNSPHRMWERVDEDRVLAIRSRAAGGESFASLAKEFNVTDVAVSYVVHRKTWRHV